MELDLLITVVTRVTIVYAFLFLMVRLLGKRHLGLHSAFDLVIAILLANLASEAIFGTVTLLHCLLAIGMVTAWHFCGRRLSFHSPTVQHWLRSGPTVVVRDGELVPHALRAERLPEAELWELLRQQGISEITEVKLALLEPSGQLSLIRQDWAREARKSDLPTATVAMERGEV